MDARPTNRQFDELLPKKDFRGGNFVIFFLFNIRRRSLLSLSRSQRVTRKPSFPSRRGFIPADILALARTIYHPEVPFQRELFQ